jgi:2-C-methyl-D-erythritol 2,4-cyclodiphosphate synthase
MKKNFSEILRVDPEVIGIKATTEEGMGFTGAGEGIAASAVCLLYKNSGVS